MGGKPLRRQTRHARCLIGKESPANRCKRRQAKSIFITRLDMNYLHISRAPRNFISSPIEFSNPTVEFPASPRLPATAAGGHLHRRFRVAAGIADLLASLAGLGNSEELLR
jgi:hypothetical protein